MLPFSISTTPICLTSNYAAVSTIEEDCGSDHSDTTASNNIDNNGNIANNNIDNSNNIDNNKNIASDNESRLARTDNSLTILLSSEF